jgi:hypothetical protein
MMSVRYIYWPDGQLEIRVDGWTTFMGVPEKGECLGGPPSGADPVEFPADPWAGHSDRQRREAARIGVALETVTAGTRPA